MHIYRYIIHIEGKWYLLNKFKHIHISVCGKREREGEIQSMYTFLERKTQKRYEEADTGRKYVRILLKQYFYVDVCETHSKIFINSIEIVITQAKSNVIIFEKILRKTLNII